MPRTRVILEASTIWGIISTLTRRDESPAQLAAKRYLRRAFPGHTRPGKSCPMRARYIYISGIASFLILLGVGGLTMQEMRLLPKLSRGVNQGYASLLDLEIVISQAKDVETGTRGYIMTKDTVFLETYYRGRQYLWDNLVPVLSRQRQMNSAPYYNALLDSLKDALDTRLAIANRLIELTRQDSLSLDRRDDLALVQDGRKSMENARRLAEEIRAYHREALARQSHGLSDYADNIPIYVSTLAGLALVMLAALFYILTEQLRQLRAYRDSLESRFIELKTAYENLGRYNTLANHHLKEPVRKMLLFLDRYKAKQAGKTSPPETTLLDKLDELARHAYLLLEDLGAISELDSDARPQKKTINLDAAVGTVIQRLQSAIQAREALVRVKPGLPEVQADARQIDLLLQHLVDNALKFGPSDAPLRIDIAAHIEPVSSDTERHRLPPGVRQVCRLSVADNGRGIAEEHLGKVFQLFYQIRGEGDEEGTGLGLAMCQKIAQLHGGYIEVRSAENRGSIFTLVLPA